MNLIVGACFVLMAVGAIGFIYCIYKFEKEHSRWIAVGRPGLYDAKNYDKTMQEKNDE